MHECTHTVSLCRQTHTHAWCLNIAVQTDAHTCMVSQYLCVDGHLRMVALYLCDAGRSTTRRTWSGNSWLILSISSSGSSHAIFSETTCLAACTPLSVRAVRWKFMSCGTSKPWVGVVGMPRSVRCG